MRFSFLGCPWKMERDEVLTLPLGTCLSQRFHKGRMDRMIRNGWRSFSCTNPFAETPSFYILMPFGGETRSISEELSRLSLCKPSQKYSSQGVTILPLPCSFHTTGHNFIFLWLLNFWITEELDIDKQLFSCKTKQTGCIGIKGPPALAVVAFRLTHFLLNN